LGHKLSASQISKILRILISLTIASFVVGCGNENADRPEVIKKLRALGVEQSPVNAKPGDVVTYRNSIWHSSVSSADRHKAIRNREWSHKPL